MARIGWRRFVGGGAAAFLIAWCGVDARRAHACQEPPSTSWSDFSPPRDSVDVPLNVQIVASYKSFYNQGDFGPRPICWSVTSDWAPIVRPVGEVDAVQTSVTLRQLIGSYYENARVIELTLTPSDDLQPETEYEVFGRDCFDEMRVLTTFTTGLERDDEPPGLESSVWTCPRVWYDLEPYGSCGSRMDRLELATLQSTATGATRFLYYDSAASTSPFGVFGSELTAMEISDPVGDFGWDPAPTWYPPRVYREPGQWKVVAVDRAGNRSDPVVATFSEGCPPLPPEPVDNLDGGASDDGGVATDAGASTPVDAGGVTPRADGGGCTAHGPTPGSAGGLWLFIALVWIRRRRAGFSARGAVRSEPIL